MEEICFPYHFDPGGNIGILPVGFHSFSVDFSDDKSDS